MLWMRAITPLATLVFLFVPSVGAAEPEHGAERRENVNAVDAGLGANETVPSSPSPITSPLSLSDIEQPATTVSEWLTQIAQASVVQITGVQLNSTDGEIALILQTAGELVAPEISVVGNAVIADIPNAVLMLPEGDEFSAAQPAEGIALVNITNLPNNRVRVAITGTEAPPVVEISTAAFSLVFSVTPGTAAGTDDDAIQIVVTGEEEGSNYFVPNASTATRTDTPLRDTPQSIQVIPRQVIADQQATRIEDVVENASGVTFLGNTDGRTSRFAIRGFDDAPTLRDGFQIPNGISEVANLERVEVLRGPASILFGAIEPGGSFSG